MPTVGVQMSLQVHRDPSRFAQSRIKDYGEAAGIHRLHAHALRHACATYLLQGGADITHVQRILGHSQITTTAEYAKVYAGDLKKVIEKKHPRENLYRRKK